MQKTRSKKKKKTLLNKKLLSNEDFVSPNKVLNLKDKTNKKILRLYLHKTKAFHELLLPLRG